MGLRHIMIMLSIGATLCTCINARNIAPGPIPDGDVWIDKRNTNYVYEQPSADTKLGSNTAFSLKYDRASNYEGEQEDQEWKRSLEEEEKCKDIDKDCLALAKKGMCRVNEKYMSDNCKLTCDKCERMAYKDEGEQEDQEWKRSLGLGSNLNSITNGFPLSGFNRTLLRDTIIKGFPRAEAEYAATESANTELVPLYERRPRRANSRRRPNKSYSRAHMG